MMHEFENCLKNDAYFASAPVDWTATGKKGYKLDWSRKVHKRGHVFFIWTAWKED